MSNELSGKKDLVAVYTKRDPKEYYKKKLYLYILLIILFDLLIIVGFLYYYFYKRGALPFLSDIVYEANISKIGERKHNVRTDSRRTGAFFYDRDGEAITLYWCEEEDGIIRNQYEDGLSTGRKVMFTHVVKIFPDNKISVLINDSGNTSIFKVLNVLLKDSATANNLRASVADLEEGDCVILEGVRGDYPVTVYGVL